MFAGAKVGMRLLQKFDGLSQFTELEGWRLWIYTIRFRIVKLSMAMLRPMCIKFVTSGMIRVYIQTAYDLNFSIFLQFYDF
jgi:hypothetical protein